MIFLMLLRFSWNCIATRDSFARKSEIRTVPSRCFGNFTGCFDGDNFRRRIVPGAGAPKLGVAFMFDLLPLLLCARASSVCAFQMAAGASTIRAPL